MGTDKELQICAANLGELLKITNANAIRELLISVYKDYSYLLIDAPERINNDSPDQLYYLSLLMDLFNLKAKPEDQLQ
ncbi:hypothetical protein [Pedobacter antarcticus]|uniref:hypothetical protein n=1 Tax=Pedobacter antarcticus TaxID=34086 RepID=UPI0029300FD4|nr:hypothetical protein [Pedobacter antarcticus]